MKKIAIIALFVLIVAPTSAFASDGELDVTFGRGGRVTTDFDYAFFAFQSDQKIVVAGRNQNRLQLARHNPDGSLDTAFGSEGKVTPNFSGQRVWTQPSGIAVQSDEKIVVLSTFSPSYGVFEYTLGRYNSDGSRDATFGLEGSVTTKDQYASSLGIQSDGRIVVSSWNSSVGRQLLERYNSDGTPDANFGAGGKVETDLAVEARGLAIQSNGKIIVAGTSVNHRDVAIARYAGDGSLDTAFGTGGNVITAFSNPWALAARAVATQSDGKIVMAGGGLYAEAGLTLARYNSDGSLDATFGVEGKIIDGTDANSLAIQSDGKVVVGGEGLARYDGDGILDGTFGSGAYLGSDIVWTLGLQSDGKIVAVKPYSLVRYDNRNPLLRFDRPIVSLADSFTAIFSGTNMTDETYFDVRFRYPGSDRDEVVLNWQRGLSAEHAVPPNTITGTWGITGVRPHLNFADHSSAFVFVSTELRVTPAGGAPGPIERINQRNYRSQGWIEQQINNVAGGQVFSDSSDFVEIVCGPENSSDRRLIRGSVLMTLPTTANATLRRVRFRKEGLSGTRLADLTELKYSTDVVYNSPAVLVLQIDSDNDGDRDFNIFYSPDELAYSQDDPNHPAIIPNTWQQWDALNGTWSAADVSAFFSIQELVSQYPEARILDEPPIGGSGPGVYFTLGPAIPAQTYLFTDAVGYIDALIIGTRERQHSTLFDFSCSNPNE